MLTLKMCIIYYFVYTLKINKQKYLIKVILLNWQGITHCDTPLIMNTS